MYRKMINKLIEWKGSTHRKPLILWGARQTGKTWLMKEFGKKYYDNHTTYSKINMNHTSSSGFGKIGKSTGKTKTNFIGRNEMIDADLYYTVYDENKELKKSSCQI